MYSLDNIIGLGTRVATQLARFVRKERWAPGKKLKILLAGYGGARNTGGDARLYCIVQQCQDLLGKDNIELGILTLDKSKIKEYFDPSIEIIEFNSLFFRDLIQAGSRYHMTLLSDGALFTSRFANALTLFFCEMAGIMKSQKKPCLAYGCDAGRMDPFVRKAVRRLCRWVFFLARTQRSLDIVTQMRLKGGLGTDPAWTLPPQTPPNLVHNDKPLLVVSVTHPFCWPIRPSLLKLALSPLTSDKKYHYKKWYFYHGSRESEAQLKYYLDSLAHAIDHFVTTTQGTVAITGMEERDDTLCQQLMDHIKTKAQFFSPRQYNAFQISGLIQKASLCLTSDYHAGLFAMTHGSPSIAISVDERLDYLFSESQRGEYCLDAGDLKLKEKLILKLDQLWKRREAERGKILKVMPHHLKRLDNMGRQLCFFVKKNFPEFKLPQS